MTYKGYKILANMEATRFFEIDKDDNITAEATGINYQTLDDNLWYSVIDKDNWVLQSFESVAECKDFIKSELLEVKV